MNPMRSAILTALLLASGCRDWSKPVIPQDPELAALAKDAAPPICPLKTTKLWSILPPSLTYSLKKFPLNNLLNKESNP